MGLDGGDLYVDHDKKKASRSQWWVALMMVWGAAVLIWLMLSGFTQPFNGVEMRAYVKSNEQLNEYAKIQGRNWVIDVTDNMHYVAGETKTVGYIFPGTEVGIIGVMYNMSKIRTSTGMEGWVPSVFLTTDPSQFPTKGE